MFLDTASTPVSPQQKKVSLYWCSIQCLASAFSLRETEGRLKQWLRDYSWGFSGTELQSQNPTNQQSLAHLFSFQIKKDAFDDHCGERLKTMSLVNKEHCFMGLRKNWNNCYELQSLHIELGRLNITLVVKSIRIGLYSLFKRKSSSFKPFQSTASVINETEGVCTAFFKCVYKSANVARLNQPHKGIYINISTFSISLMEVL